MSNTASVHNVTRIVRTDFHRNANDPRKGWVTIEVESSWGGKDAHRTDFTFFVEDIINFSWVLQRDTDKFLEGVEDDMLSKEYSLT